MLSICWLITIWTNADNCNYHGLVHLLRNCCNVLHIKIASYSKKQFLMVAILLSDNLHNINTKICEAKIQGEGWTLTWQIGKYNSIINN